jgi:hypothetical protein
MPRSRQHLQEQMLAGTLELAHLSPEEASVGPRALDQLTLSWHQVELGCYLGLGGDCNSSSSSCKSVMRAVLSITRTVAVLRLFVDYDAALIPALMQAYAAFWSFPPLVNPVSLPWSTCCCCYSAALHLNILDAFIVVKSIASLICLALCGHPLTGCHVCS